MVLALAVPVVLPIGRGGGRRRRVGRLIGVLDVGQHRQQSCDRVRSAPVLVEMSSGPSAVAGQAQAVGRLDGGR